MVSLREAIRGPAEPDESGLKKAINSMEDLAAVLSGFEVEVRGSLELEISGVQYDSRKAGPGNLFVCIPGLKADGHKFAGMAVERGAVALVVERFLDLPVTQVKVKDSRGVLGPLAASFFGRPASRLRMIGVTGTNGKTTVTHLIEHIFAKVGKRFGLIGTLGARIGEVEFPGSRTTPEASDLQELLDVMVSREAVGAVMEVSSHALDLHRVAGCEYDVAVFTNLTQDHLDYHKSMEEYLAAKGKLFASLAQQGHKNGKKFGVINTDDPASSKLLAQTPVRAVTYGVREKADYRAFNLQNQATGVKFDVEYPGGQVRLNLKTPGMFTVYNALAAFAVGVEEGLAPELVALALAEVQGVPGRFERVEGGQPFSVIVDYAHTPDGLENVLKTAREFTRTRIITVFGCGGDRDRSKRPVMGELAARLSDLAVVTSDNPRTEDPLAIIADIKVGVNKVTDHYLEVPDRQQAILQACSFAGPGDLVLLAGKGHEDYQEINGIKYPFDDRVVARECLGRLGYGRTNP